MSPSADKKRFARSFIRSFLPTFLRNRAFFIWFVVALILLIGSAAAGFWYYRHQKETFREHEWGHLNAIAELKVKEIYEWRRSRMAEAQILLDVPSVAASVEGLLKGDAESARLGVEILSIFAANTQTEAIMVVSPNGRVVRSFPGGFTRLGSQDRLLVDSSLKERRIVFSDFHEDGDRDLHLDLFVPLYKTARSSEPLAALVFRLNPDEYLYPLIQSWPVPSRTAETLLVRREGDSVLYLNELRHIKGAALRLAVPLTRESLPASRAVLGIEGTFEGIDYRGVPVLAVTRKVPDSGWALVAKVDQEESYALARRMAKATGLQVVLLICTLGIAAGLLLGEKARQIRSKRQQFELQYQELARYSDELRSLTAHLGIREEDSRRISREIHEDLGNALAGARFSLFELHRHIPDDHPELAERIDSILADQKALMEQVRSISQHVRPAIIDQLGLVPAIKWLADDFELRTGVRCQVFSEEADGGHVEGPYASALYRICQEALSNVGTHAAADEVKVTVSENDREVLLEVADNGRGFDLCASNVASIGIISMRERARYLGGTFDIQTAPGQGTKVTVRIPLSQRT